MYRPHVVLRLVDRVCNEIEKCNDPRLVEERHAVLLRRRVIENRLVGWDPEVSRTSSQRSTTETAYRDFTVSDAQMAIAILAFANYAYQYYRKRQTYCPLADHEKVVGHDLSSLLEEIEHILPADSSEVGSPS